MPVTLNNTTITIDDGTNNFVLETVKTHVPEVDINIDIVPAITNIEGDPAFELLTYTHSGGSEDQTEFNLTINENTTFDILIVGGGGGGGHNGGGGGGGDVLYFSRVEIPIGTYVVKVGRGGTGVTGSNTGATTHGIKSEFYNIVAGGGGRGMAFSFTNIADGISVTENYINPLTGVSSTSKGGNGGVRNTANGGATKGGDGAGGIALPVTSDNAATDGGPGIYNDITGTNIGYGGGGGGRDVSAPEHHGNGVDGGASSFYGPSAISGRGGGGASEFNSGGSGIVILRKYIEPVALYEEQATVTQNPVLPADSTNLVAWYKFDGNGNDSSGNDKHLTEYNIDYVDSEIVDEASKFIGTSYYEISNDGYFSLDTFSISVWCNLPGTGSAKAIASLRGTNPNNGWIIYKYDQVLHFWYFGGSSAIQIVNVFNNGWVHLTMTTERTSGDTCNTKIYINGIEQYSGSNTYIRNTGNNLRIGAGRNESTPDYYLENNSLLDDFRIYDKALSAYEIDILANNKTENPDYKILTFKYQEPSYPVIDDLYNQTSYTVNFPEESECDILIVGGGGGGGKFGGGGGAGAILFKKGANLNGNVNVKVGRGGVGSSSQNVNGENGKDSSITISGTEYISVGGGGGGGGTRNSNTDGRGGNNGGSGGGGSHSNSSTTANTGGISTKNTYTGWESYGNAGGEGKDGTGGAAPDHASGGGGGAGSVGSNISSTGGGNGGAGKEFISYFGNNVGHNGWFAGGGGGNTYQGAGNPGYPNGGNGLFGGGGIGGFDGGTEISAGEGLTGTGGGGGGAKYDGGTAEDIDGGDGGSGIVIIRYKTKYIRQHPAYDAQWTYHSTNPNVHHYGNVGIGTLASETNKLTVKGDINVIGDIYENNNKIAYGWDVSGNSVYNKYGNVGIGTNDPRYALHTTGVIYAGQGGITENTSTSWTVTSDNRIKENIEKASYDICSENIKNINLYRFNYNTKYVKTTDKNQLGFIAQDVRKYFPKAVKNKTTRFDNDVVPNLLSVDVTQLNYTMYGAVKHIGQDIDAIKEKLGITEVPNDVKNQPYFTEVIPFNDPDV